MSFNDINIKINFEYLNLNNNLCATTSPVSNKEIEINAINMIKCSISSICAIIAESIMFGREAIDNYDSQESNHDVLQFNEKILFLTDLLIENNINNIKLQNKELIYEKIINIIIDNVYKFSQRNIFFIEKIANEKFIKLIESDGNNFYKFNGKKINDNDCKDYSIIYNNDAENNVIINYLEFYFKTDFNNNLEYFSIQKDFNHMISDIVLELSNL